jgi:hypothetical protein
VLKKLLNRGEDHVRRQIISAADGHGAHVHSKMRVADVIDITQLKDHDAGTYALMAHFDFVVADDEQSPQFAVEFDGPGHDPVHDRKKDEICRHADLALFRVNLPISESKIDQLSFLDYLVNLWFFAFKFEEMRANGEVSDDEPFMISGFLKPDAKNIFDSEFELLSPACEKINAYCKRKNIARGALSHLSVGWLLMGNDVGEFAAFSIFPIDQTKLYGRATLGLKIPNFGPLSDVQFTRQELGQYCTALAIHELFEQLKLYHGGSGHILRRQDEIRTEVQTLLSNGFSTLLAMSMGDNELTELTYRCASVLG